MKDIWKVDYQLFPTNIHCRNVAERVICTFKVHFLEILYGVAKEFPKTLWDILLPQTDMTINLLQQSTLKPTISAWEYFNGPSSYNHAPLVPLSCKDIIHKKTSTCHSWDFYGKDG